FLECEPLNLRGRQWPNDTKRISLSKIRKAARFAIAPRSRADQSVSAVSIWRRGLRLLVGRPISCYISMHANVSVTSPPGRARVPTGAEVFLVGRVGRAAAIG